MFSKIFLALLITAIVPVSAFASIRISLRHAMFCSNLLTAAGSYSPAERRDVFASLAVLRQSSRNTRTLDRLDQISRAYATPDDGAKVIAAIKLTGATEIAEFLDLLDRTRTQMGIQAKSELENAGVLQQVLGEFHYPFSPMVALTSAVMTLAFPVNELYTFIHEHALNPAAFGLTAGLAVFGAFDYWYHHLRTYQFGHSDLLHAFRRREPERVPARLWSRDATVSSRFVDDLCFAVGADWRIIDAENRSENRAGVFRLFAYEKMRQRNVRKLTFATDILQTRNASGDEQLILILRTHAKVKSAFKQETPHLSAPWRASFSR